MPVDISENIRKKSHSAINIAVVGHTNTGKTSLIRTLLRDDRFGEIEDMAGTTRYVEKSTIFCADDAVLDLFDTPGFEDSSALLQALDEFSKTLHTRMPADLLHAFIAQVDAFPDFEQEIKVLRQAINSDVLLYIIDVREPLLGKYLDEVEILSKVGKPILPVFNFIAGNQASLTRWREQMTQFNLHSALEFDTVAFDFESEKRLYQKLQSLIEAQYDPLQALIDYRQDVWENLNHAAAQCIFQLLTEVTCYRREIDEKNGISDTDIALLQAFVRRAEQRVIGDLLSIFMFTQTDINIQQLAVHDGQWELDIFSAHTLKDFGLNAGSTALKGAAAGVGIDLMVGGLSLGAATLLGAAVGAGWATVRRYQQEFKAAWRGHKWLCVDDNTVSLLYLRQRKLLHTLTQRGHAAQNRLQLANDEKHTLPKHWYKKIKVMRQNPQWQHNASTETEYEKLQIQVIDGLLNDEIKG
ncbi:probable integral membrane protein NMA1898 [hydrothermal vent metagenome]|uniref:Probable integral membrane protein NMA1898 n=1 Tax=hydrothermal vent metagenome TaxID=652676 RepID=A0A3B0X3H1_9ZZZZ